MTNYAQHVAKAGDLTHEEQKKAGAPVGGAMGAKHRDFLKNIKQLVESGAIDPYDPKTFLKMEVYSVLPEEWQDKTDLTLINLGSLLKQVYELYIRKDTPDESPQYQTMIEQLWAMKQTIEQQYDVFKF